MHVFLKVLTSRKNIASCCLVLNVIGGSNISLKWLTAKCGGYLGNIFLILKKKFWILLSIFSQLLDQLLYHSQMCRIDLQEP